MSNPRRAEEGQPLPEDKPDIKPTLRVSDLVISDEHITVHIDEDLKLASRKMLNAKVSIALVLDAESRVVGVLKSNDILDRVLEGIVPEKTPVSAIMIRDFIKIKIDEDLAKLAPKLKKTEQKHIVVVDANGKYKGYFSLNDLRHSREILVKMGYNPFDEG
jgi:predicted transcriptional regulator